VVLVGSVNAVWHRTVRPEHGQKSPHIAPERRGSAARTVLQSRVLCSRVRLRVRQLRCRCRARRVHAWRGVVRLPDRTSASCCICSPTPAHVVSKDQLIAVGMGWPRCHRQQLGAGDLGLRRSSATARSGARTFKRCPRQGYRFCRSVTRTTARASDDSLEALLAPHRAWIDGRAALETLERDQIVRARGVFEGVLRSAPGSGVGARRPRQRLHHAVRDDARR
jgi:hypothetical protein